MLENSVGSSLEDRLPEAVNKLPLPKALPSNLKVNEEFLKQVQSPSTFSLYKVSDV